MLRKEDEERVQSIWTITEAKQHKMNLSGRTFNLEIQRFPAVLGVCSTAECSSFALLK
jgi:hypothetical protein